MRVRQASLYHLVTTLATGRILNRFSSDSATVDDSLPFILNILLANIFSFLGILVVLLWMQALLLLPCIPLFFLYRRLASYYQVLYFWA